MINLAGKTNCDNHIKEELYLAGLIPIKVEKTNSEVPYTLIAKVGNWTLTRAWYYWVATVENREEGLTVDTAMLLYEQKNPIDENHILGEVIRTGGDGCKPNGYVASPVYTDELCKQLVELGFPEVEMYGKVYSSISRGDMAKLCNEGKLKIERYVDCYHIDDQIGLTEFAKFITWLELNPMLVKIKNYDCYKHCGNIQPSGGADNICLNCGSGIIKNK